MLALISHPNVAPSSVNFKTFPHCSPSNVNINLPTELPKTAQFLYFAINSRCTIVLPSLPSALPCVFLEPVVQEWRGDISRRPCKQNTFSSFYIISLYKISLRKPSPPPPAALMHHGVRTKIFSV
jgi:hypothetical protein